ncbi:DUF3039 domain-containing protein [Williamsia sp. D3]|uniref:DUF3039 domain-containing protein n=1 Tax=Williamsia sp. D3 TaxID=1313067 RepID=UPI0003D30EE6|nr:DUF3039 domain-containing protein [Williamsia sp. D3]ETD34422.1 hypothetical protein W823_01470 [Williamsia sp. D3]
MTDDWGDAEQQRGAKDSLTHPPAMSDLNHPAIRHTVDVFDDMTGDHQREGISGLTSPMFYKLKTNRWRGAVLVEDDGQVWLVAAGLRRGGERTDFYKEFSANVHRVGVDKYLPTEDDRERLRLEIAEYRLANWEQTIHDLALEALASVGFDGRATWSIPGLFSEEVIAEIDIEVFVESNDADEPEGYGEVTIACTVLDWEQFDLVKRGELLAMCAIEPQEQSWSAAHGPQAYVYSISGNAHELETTLGAALSSQNTTPGVSVPGVVAHYSHSQRLTEQYVEGKAAKALCGKIYVPRQNPDGLEKCPDCAKVHVRMASSER